MLDYGRSYAPHVNAVAQVMPKHVQCVHTLGFNAALTTAFHFHTPWKLESGLNTATGTTCNWLSCHPRRLGCHGQRRRCAMAVGRASGTPYRPPRPLAGAARRAP